MDSNYLTFQDLGLHAKMFKNVTYGSRAVGLPSLLNVGGQTFHTLYVNLVVIFVVMIVCLL